jgi:hypothetical protein
MGKLRAFGDLQIQYDPAHERKEWFAQRVAWTLMALIVAAALAGLLGPGPLSNARAGNKGSKLSVECSRFARYQGPETLRIFCQPESGQEFRVSLDRSYVERIQIHGISPEPKETIARSEQYIYVFAREQEGEQLVLFDLHPNAFGRTETRIMLDNIESVTLTQFYWP